MFKDSTTVINPIFYLNEREYLLGTKKYFSPGKFLKGRKQLAHYARSRYCYRDGLDKAVYLIFTPRHIEYGEDVVENVETHEGVQISIFLVSYDEKKDF